MHLSIVIANTHARAHTHKWLTGLVTHTQCKLAIIIIIHDIHNIRGVCVWFGSTKERAFCCEVFQLSASCQRSQRTTTSSRDATCRQLNGGALQGLWNRKSPAHLHWSLVRQAHNNRSSLGLNSTYQLSVIPALDHLRFFTASRPGMWRPSSLHIHIENWQGGQHRESIWGSQVTQQCFHDTAGLVKHAAPVKEAHICQHFSRWAAPVGTTRKSRLQSCKWSVNNVPNCDGIPLQTYLVLSTRLSCFPERRVCARSCRHYLTAEFPLQHAARVSLFF